MTPSSAPPSSEDIQARFTAALDQELALLGIDTLVSEEARRDLLKHYLLLAAWNRRVAMTTLTEPEAAAVGLCADSLAALPLLADRDPAALTLLDIGSGGGFPGIPLALALPSLRVTLAERRQGKATFLAYAVRALGLGDRARAIADDLGPSRPPASRFDIIASRATFSDPQWLAMAAAWLTPDAGVLLAYDVPGGPACAPPEGLALRGRYDYHLSGYRAPRVTVLLAPCESRPCGGDGKETTRC